MSDPRAPWLDHGVPLQEAKALCVFVHGRGQSPGEMVAHVLDQLDVGAVAFRLPAAEGGSWYDARATDPLTAQTEAQLSASLDRLAETVDELRAQAPGRPLLLAGFSQGACLSIEYACRSRGPLDALVAFTGCRLGTAGCERPNGAMRDLPVYLTGSDADPWIPNLAFDEATIALATAGAALRADIFPGRGHEVSGAEVAMLGSVLSDLTAGEIVRMVAAR